MRPVLRASPKPFHSVCATFATPPLQLACGRGYPQLFCHVGRIGLPAEQRWEYNRRLTHFHERRSLHRMKPCHRDLLAAVRGYHESLARARVLHLAFRCSMRIPKHALPIEGWALQRERKGAFQEYVNAPLRDALASLRAGAATLNEAGCESCRRLILQIRATIDQLEATGEQLESLRERTTVPRRLEGAEARFGDEFCERSKTA
jgi:hypothetical protein